MKFRKQKFTNYIAAIFILFFVWGCGDDGPSQSQTETSTFSGTTQATSATSCSGDSHVFQAAEGNVSVTLVQSTGNTGLAVQVCAGGLDNNNCTINQTPIAVGQTISGTKKGGESQTLVLQPCGAGGTPPSGPINYTATVVFQRP